MLEIELARLRWALLAEMPNSTQSLLTGLGDVDTGGERKCLSHLPICEKWKLKITHRDVSEERDGAQHEGC